MSEVETLFVCWPVGVALSCWLLFEMATRHSRVGQIAFASPRRREINFVETWSFV